MSPALHHTEPEPVRAILYRPGFEPAVNGVCITVAVARGSNNEQTNVPNVRRQKIGNNIRHRDQFVLRIDVADEPLFRKAPARWRLAVNFFLRGLSRVGLRPYVYYRVGLAVAVFALYSARG